MSAFNKDSLEKDDQSLGGEGYQEGICIAARILFETTIQFGSLSGSDSSSSSFRAP